MRATFARSELEGIALAGEDRINDFINAPGLLQANAKLPGGGSETGGSQA